MRKVISIILTICMLSILSLTPVHVNAETLAEQPTVTESNGTVAEVITEPEIWQNPLEENIYTKIVDNGDGTCTATVYDHPVRFVNEEGRLQDISLEIAPLQTELTEPWPPKAKLYSQKQFRTV